MRSWKTECDFLDRAIAPDTFPGEAAKAVRNCEPAPAGEPAPVGEPAALWCPSVENILFVVDVRPEAHFDWVWLLGQPRWPVPACAEKKGPLHAQYPRYTESVHSLGTAEYRGKLHETALRGDRSYPHLPGRDTLDKRAPVLRALDGVLEQMDRGSIDLVLFAFDGVSDERIDPGHLPRKARFGQLVQNLRRFADKRMGIFVVASPASYQYLYILSSERATPYARALSPLIRESFEDALHLNGRRLSPVVLEVAPGPRRDPYARWEAAEPRVRLAPTFGAEGGDGDNAPAGLTQLKLSKGRLVPMDGPIGQQLPPRAGLNLLPWLDASMGDARRWAVAIEWTRRKAPVSGAVLSPVIIPPPLLVTNQRQVLLGWKPGAAVEQVDVLAAKPPSELKSTFGLSGVADMGEGCTAAPTSLGSAAGVHGRVYPLLGLNRDAGVDTWSLRVQMAHVPAGAEPLSRALAERVLGVVPADGGGDELSWTRGAAEQIKDSFARLPQTALVSPGLEIDPCFESIADGVDLFWTSHERLEHHASCNDSPLRGLERELARTAPSSFAWTGHGKRVGASTLVDLVRELHSDSRSSSDACVLVSLRIMTEMVTGNVQGHGGSP
ncbi:MAG: hypothetical protein IT372_28825 [Polyangiaceae bacterium]|nr:hypothetical protein [Polyangiaceae bacterium]